MDDQSDKISRLEDRIEQLEAKTKKMMPSRRDALKYGGAAVLGAAAMSGSASAGSAQVGTIGDSNNLVDVEAEDINVDDTLTTQDLVVNGTVTGPFGGGGVVLESGDSITIETISLNTSNETFVNLYNGTAKDVLGGIIMGGINNDFLYTFSDTTTLHKNDTGTTYTANHASRGEDHGGDDYEATLLPPALDVTKIDVGTGLGLGGKLGAEVILKD